MTRSVVLCEKEAMHICYLNNNAMIVKDKHFCRWNTEGGSTRGPSQKRECCCKVFKVWKYVMYSSSSSSHASCAYRFISHTETGFSRLLLLFSALHKFLLPSPALRSPKYENKLHVIRRKITVFRRCWWNLFLHQVSDVLGAKMRTKTKRNSYT